MWLTMVGVTAGAGFRADPVQIAHDPRLQEPMSADFDGDGSIELIAPDYLSIGVRYWTGHPPSSSLIPGATGPRAVADFTGDGVPDLMVGNELRAYGPDWPVVANFAQWIYGEPADIDTDGDVDMLGSLGIWYENTGSGTSFLDNPLVGVPNGAYCRPFDLDEDSDIDLLCNDGSLSWYEGDGSGFSWTAHSLWSGFYELGLFTPIDVDQDGALDLVGTAIRLIGNQGIWEAKLIPGDLDDPDRFGPATTLLTPISSARVWPTEGYLAMPGAIYPFVGQTLGQPISVPWAVGDLLWLDWDGDSVSDELLSAWDVSVVVDDFATTPTAEIVSISPYGGGFGAGDLDGDDRQDLNFGWVFYRRADSLGRSFEEELILPTLGEFDWGDFDADGAIDVVDHEDLIERDPVTGTWSETQLFDSNSYLIHATREGDLDGDGDLDILALEEEGLTLWRNEGATFTPLVVKPGKPYGAALGDLDGDSDLDIVALTVSGERWFENRLGGTIWIERVLSNDFCAYGLQPIELNDLDGDGDQDILISGSCDRIYERTSAGFTKHTLALGDVAAVGDLDVDGDLDVFTSDVFAGLAWMEHRSSSIVDFESHIVDANGYGYGYGGLQLLDLDEDGDLDVGVTSLNGLMFLRNDVLAPTDDADSDGVAYAQDLCPDDWDGEQADGDEDGTGDVCDCGPDDPGRSRVAPESCDAIDQDCNGLVDEGFDADADGRTTCGTDGVAGTLDDDCADTDASIAPGLLEVPYDGVDQDCDSATLDDDLDQDGFVLADDCDDLEQNMNPAMAEVPYDGLDNDCDALTLEDDLDQDGFILAVDCADADSAVHPGAQEFVYDGTDNDCDPETHDDDLDGDGYLLAVDCDDEDTEVSPGAEEIPYDGLDNDCDSATREDDLDEDGFVLADDCEDSDESIHPGQVEAPYDGLDQDCDPTTPDDDLDGDDFVLAEDCADDDAAVHPNAAEIPYDGVDQDCDVETPDDDLDDDGARRNQDCDDLDPERAPDVAEIRGDGIDNDCNSATSDTVDCEDCKESCGCRAGPTPGLGWVALPMLLGLLRRGSRLRPQ